MGFLKNLFKGNKAKNKYNIKAHKNQPREVYGIPNPKRCNKDTKK